MLIKLMHEIMGALFENWHRPIIRPAYLVDRGGPSGVRKAKRAAQKRRNVRARSKK